MMNWLPPETRKSTDILEDRVIEVHFHADKLGLQSTGTKLLVGNIPFVGDAFPLERPVFPFTSRA